MNVPLQFLDEELSVLRSLNHHALLLPRTVHLLGPPGDTSRQAVSCDVHSGQARDSPAAAGLTMGVHALHSYLPSAPWQTLLDPVAWCKLSQACWVVFSSSCHH